MKPRCDMVPSGHAVTQFPPKWTRSGRWRCRASIAQMALSYSGTLASVPSRSTANPPAFTMALSNWLAVRCSVLSRRSRAILWRSSPYFLMRRSRYDRSPKDVCRSRTVAEAARFSRSTGPLVSYQSIFPSEKTTSPVRGVNLSATL